jgi:hypothetical protein
MSSSNLIRWSGLAALVGGLLWIVLEVAFLIIVGDQPESVAAVTSAWVILLVLALVGNMLILLGLVGLYARQVAETGVLGLVAFLVAFFGTALFVGLNWTFTFAAPSLAQAAPEVLDADPSGVLGAGFILTFVLFGLGWLLFGLASLRAGVLPRGAAVLLVVGAVLIFVLSLLELPFSAVVFGIALAWIGYALWAGAGEGATEAKPAP